MFWKRKTVEEKLLGIKKIKIHGIIFKIKRLNTVDCLTGAKVLLKSYDTYKVGKAEEGSLKSMIAHYKDVFMSSVIEPKLSRKEEDGSILVDNLFTDYGLVSELYESIIHNTYGKKKI